MISRLFLKGNYDQSWIHVSYYFEVWMCEHLLKSLIIWSYSETNTAKKPVSIFYHKLNENEKSLYFKLFIIILSYLVIFYSILLLLLLLSCFSRIRLCAIHRRQPTSLPRPWDSPGKNTGVGCHFLLQCVKVKSESEVVQSCLALRDPMDCSLPGSSVHGIFLARVLEWGAIAFSSRAYYWSPKKIKFLV